MQVLNGRLSNKKKALRKTFDDPRKACSKQRFLRILFVPQPACPPLFDQIPK